MDQTSELILSVKPVKYNEVVLETNHGFRYWIDLSSFSKVYCYPKDEKEWFQVSIDGYGLDLIWPSRFEVHVDQLIELATKKIPLSLAS